MCWILVLHAWISKLSPRVSAPALPAEAIQLASTVCLGAGAAGGLALLARGFPRSDRPPQRPGSRGSWIFWGICLGIIVNGTCPALLTLLGRGRIAMLSPLSAETAIITLISYAASTVWEELAFRRFLVRALRPLGAAPAVVMSAAVFAAFHFLKEDPAWNRLVFLSALGVLLGIAYWRSGSLAFAIGIHGGLNLMHLALGGDPGFPAIWPFVIRMKDSDLIPLLLLGILMAGIFANLLVNQRRPQSLSGSPRLLDK